MDNKSCENCYHFNPHYFFNGQRFVYAECGNCINGEMRLSSRKRKMNLDACDKWEPREAKNQENLEHIVHKMERAAKNIDEILTVLRSDFLD